ncbi:unnamed protein product [Lasius platythorax]|uniref:HAT C-terminal dimerisation domain-containing protein n=1 Tax=Lasius platythorax TaxID=488582 RepID=A0AAV2N9N1_9HYME
MMKLGCLLRKVKMYGHESLVTNKSDSITGESDGLCLKLRQYLNQPVIPRTEDPLKYWQKLRLAYPSLNKIAMRYLNIVGTSVASERLFSKAGAIKVDNRSRLSGEHLNQLLFLGCLGSKDWGFAA